MYIHIHNIGDGPSSTWGCKSRSKRGAENKIVVGHWSCLQASHHKSCGLNPAVDCVGVCGASGCLLTSKPERYK